MELDPPDEVIDAVQVAHNATSEELEAAKKAGRAAYMRFYRSLRTATCPLEIVEKYRQSRGSAIHNNLAWEVSLCACAYRSGGMKCFVQLKTQLVLVQQLLGSRVQLLNGFVLFCARTLA